MNVKHDLLKHASVGFLVFGCVAYGCSSSSGGGSTFDAGGEGGSSGASSGVGTSSGGTSGAGASSGSTDCGTGICIGNQCLTNPAACQPTTCADGGIPDGGAAAATTLSGVVYDPAGRTPLYNVVVWIPQFPTQALPAITTGASCVPCDSEVHNPLSPPALTDATGTFHLTGVPVGTPFTLVMQLGKWRRQVTIPALPQSAACHNTTLTGSAYTNILPLRLPRNQTEGSIPQFAITTGGADPLECLLRKVGISDSEFTTSSGMGRVHLFTGGGYSMGNPSSSFAPSLNGGATFPNATTLWDSATTLQNYDIVLMACEGQPVTRTGAELQNMFNFENQGGRVFASHWHDQWFEYGPSPLPSTGTWTDTTPPPTAQPVEGTIDQSFYKGQAFYTWLGNVMALDSNNMLPIYQAKDNLTAVGNTAQQWVTITNPQAGGATSVQYMSFNTPLDIDAAAQCGRVVYSDLHVSSGNTNDAGVPEDQTGRPFPTGCVTNTLSPQEKALEFMLFDLSACITSDVVQPPPPM